MPRRQSIQLSGFAHRNPIPAACRIGPLLVSGVLTGRDPETGVMPDGLDAQCANVFAHVRELMAAAGGSTDDIAKMTFFLAESRDREALNREWVAMFPDPDDRPARHSAAAALDDGSLVQCDVLAYLPDSAE
ncbi:RidA family protein [Microbacterium elymi]|uniref:RidA family protein n=1 Tax=Microbacterium elymi TaxID=2909587 RepID=A0ABY5NI08_9MICO|nr:RidA family protein [Microbacterium elymi]UUT34778.1 RidA family protein [Microbacterium elymi]